MKLTGGDILFTPELVGKNITISGSSTMTNDGTFVITSVLDHSSLTYTNPGVGANDPGSISGASAQLVQNGQFTTLTDAGAAFTSSMVGVTSRIHISGSSTPANNGIFPIYAVLSSTSVIYANPQGKPDPGPVSWGVGEVNYTLGGGFNSGENTALRDLTLFCKDDPDAVTNNTGHGVHFTTPIIAERVYVQNFANHGFFGRGAYASGFSDGSVDFSKIRHCVTGACGIDGFHVEGADASACTFLSNISSGCRRYGHYDASRSNTYIGCHSENDGAYGRPPPIGVPDGTGDTVGGHGAPFHTEGNNTSTFIGCTVEGSGGHSSHFNSPANIFGGELATPDGITDESVCFANQGGVASQLPFSYSNTRGSTVIRTDLGQQTNDKTALALAFPALGDTLSLKFYDVNTALATGFLFPGWWVWEQASFYRHIMAWPMISSNARQPTVWCENGIFLGRYDTVPHNGIAFTAAPSPPSQQVNTLAQTYEVGDVVWQSAPVAGGPLGQVCVTQGTQNVLPSTTGNLPALGTALTLTSTSGFVAGQWVTIAGVTGPRLIDAINYMTGVATLHTAGDNAGNLVGAAVNVVFLGTVSVGSVNLVLNTGPALQVGQYIAIAGASISPPYRQIAALGTPAALECGTPQNYTFSNGDTLLVSIDRGAAQVINFAAGAGVSAATVAATLNAQIARATATVTSGGTKVTITSNTIGGGVSFVQVMGGTANAALGFPTPPTPGSEASGTADTSIVTLNSGADASVTNAVVTFSPAAFSLFGTIHTRGEDAGQFSIAMADADQTMTGAQVYSATIVKATGALTADRNLRVPAPAADEDSYQRTVRNTTTGGHNLLVDVVGGGAPITIGNAKTAIIGFDSGGAFRVTQDI
jgi:hypothetical protein